MLETEEHHRFRETVRRFVTTEIDPYVRDWDRQRTFPARQLFGRLASLGLLGLEYDRADDGQGADHSFTVILSEELGRAEGSGVPLAVAVHNDMATPSLHRHGSSELKERYLAPACRGELVAALAVTEPDAGSDVAGLRTSIARSGDELIINGRKLYVTNGAQADWLCLLGRSSDEGGHRGMSQVVVPTHTPGVEVSPPLETLGNHASGTVEIVLEDVVVPADHVIGVVGRGFQQQMEQFARERLVGAYGAIGGAEHALSRTREHLRTRHAFGRPLLANQHIQFAMAELAAELDVVRQHAYATATALAAGQDVTRAAAIAKLKATRLSQSVADACLQFHGGAGYLEETWTSRYFRDSRLGSIGGGPDEVMLQLLAHLDGYVA